MTFETGVYILSGFLFLFGVVFLYAASQTPPPKKNTLTRINHVINTRHMLALFGLIYLGLSHFGVYAGLGYGIEYTNLAPCENVIVNSTDVNATTSIYSYADSCASRTTPEATQNLFVIMTWMIVVLFLAVMVAAFVWWWRKWSQW